MKELLVKLKQQTMGTISFPWDNHRSSVCSSSSSVLLPILSHRLLKRHVFEGEDVTLLISTISSRTFLGETGIFSSKFLLTCAIRAAVLLHAKVPPVLHTLACVSSVQMSVQWNSQPLHCYTGSFDVMVILKGSWGFPGPWEQRAGPSHLLSGRLRISPSYCLPEVADQIQLLRLLTPKMIFLGAGTRYFLAQLCYNFPSERKFSNTRKENISEISNSRPVRSCILLS